MGGKGKVVNGGRIRKVTITEIDNDQEWNWPNPGNLDDEVETQIYEDVIEKTTDEVFAALEDVVTDWKIKLEVVVGEGLKKIKRTSREKKAMMKYLPGDGVSIGGAVLTKAKKEILNDWKTEVAKTVKETHNKLNELGSAKVQDAVVVSEGILKVEVKSEMKKEKAGKQVTKGAYLDLKKLMRELDSLYQNYAADKMNYNKIPIYSVTGKNDNRAIPRTMNKDFPWWKPVCTLATMDDMPMKNALALLKDDYKDIGAILQDFVAVQAPYKSLLEEWFNATAQGTAKKSLVRVAPKKYMKTPRRGSNSILKMKERKEQRQKKQFELKEFEAEGEKHFLVVRKKATTMDEAEDIFADWNKNFAVIKRPRGLKPRVRKISHRQERKELLKAEEEKAPMGPFTYSQMVRKGLRIPKEQEMVEDIFQSWSTFLDELTEIKATHDDVQVESADDLDIFKVWKHNLHVPAERTEDLDILCSTHPSILPGLDCGQPTVKKAVLKKNEAKMMQQNISKNTKVSEKPAKNPVIVEKVTEKQPVTKPVVVKPNAIPIPPPPPPPPAKKPYEPVEPHKQLLPYVERARLQGCYPLAREPVVAATKPIPLPAQSASSALAASSAQAAALKPSVDWKPSAQSQMMLTSPVKAPVGKGVVDSKMQPTAEQIYKYAKARDSANSNWQSMIATPGSPTSRGDSGRKMPSKPEEVFQSWRDIFSEENTQTKAVEANIVSTWVDFELAFMEWAELNLKEPEERKRRESENDESPKASRKAIKKQIKTENIEEDITEEKENRRHDFARNASIKDKKRGEAARKSTGKRIK